MLDEIIGENNFGGEWDDQFSKTVARHLKKFISLALANILCDSSDMIKAHQCTIECEGLKRKKIKWLFFQ